MNNDLISRSALIDALPIVTKDRKVSLFGVVFDFVDIICNAPAVDAVEVVRCKDCKYFLTEKLLCTHEGNMVFNTGKTTYPNCFCSYGERKEDG